MKKLWSLFILLFLTNTQVFPQKAWTWHGHGPFHHKDEADGITLDSDGNTYIAGRNTFLRHWAQVEMKLRRIVRIIYMLPLPLKGTST